MGNLSYIMDQDEITRVLEKHIESKGYELISMSYVWTKGGSRKLSAEIELNIKQIATK